MDHQMSQRQRELYLMIDRAQFPKFLNDYVTHPIDFVNLLVALHFLWKRNPARKTWILNTIAPLIRRQVRALTNRQLKMLTQTGQDLIKDNQLRGQAMLIMFTINQGDRATAVRIIKGLSEILLEGNFLQDGHLPSLHVLLNLIANQETTRTWNAYLQALKDGDSDARQAYVNLFEFWQVNQEQPIFLPVSVLPEAVEKTNDQRLLFAVPDDCLDTVNTVTAELIAQYLPDNEAIKRTLMSFWEQREAVQQKAHELWHQVETDATCDLSTAGDDGAEITIASLRQHGARRIQLIPLDDRPVARAVIWVESPVSRRHIYFEHEIRSSDLGLERVDPDNPDPNKIIGCLYRFLAIQAIWSISMGRTHAERSGASAESNGNGHGKSPRPHFRKIEHLGQHPSPEALERCLVHYKGKRTPPKGKTFVKADHHMVVHEPVLDPSKLSVVCRLGERSLHA